jgi:hypothetical protein
MHVATIERMLPVRSAPSASQVKSEFFRPRTNRLSSRTRRLFVASISLSSGKGCSRVHFPVDVAEAFAERRLRRRDGLPSVDPTAKLVEDWLTALLSPVTSLFGVVAGVGQLSLDGEQLRDDAHALERDAVAAARRFNETASREPSTQGVFRGCVSESW